MTNLDTIAFNTADSAESLRINYTIPQVWGTEGSVAGAFSPRVQIVQRLVLGLAHSQPPAAAEPPPTAVPPSEAKKLRGQLFAAAAPPAGTGYRLVPRCPSFAFRRREIRETNLEGQPLDMLVHLARTHFQLQFQQNIIKLQRPDVPRSLRTFR